MDILGGREAFETLTQTRAGMLTLSNMYVTGIGIFFVAWATIQNPEIRVMLSLISLVFMFANLAGFYENLRLQNALYKFIDGSTVAASPSREVLDRLRPFPTKRFITLYLFISAGIVIFGIVGAASVIKI